MRKTGTDTCIAQQSLAMQRSSKQVVRSCLQFLLVSRRLQRNVSGDFTTARYGESLQLTPIKSGKNGVTIELISEFSHIGPPFNIRRLNTGVQLEAGQSIYLIHERKSEESSGKASLVLITPQKFSE